MNSRCRRWFLGGRTVLLPQGALLFVYTVASAYLLPLFCRTRLADSTKFSAALMLTLDFKSKFQCVYIYSHDCLKEKKWFTVNLFLHFKEWIYTKHVRIFVSSSRICLSGLHVSWNSKNNNKSYFFTIFTYILFNMVEFTQLIIRADSLLR